jgi:RNA polymerase sigma factor (sigma-70 family)
MDTSLKMLVELAKDGDKDALESLVRQIQDSVYGLAIRMLGHPSDAEDATQEILVKIVTHLEGFKGESSFTTWMYRVATNHLLTARKSRTERAGPTFELLEEHCDQGLAGRWSGSAPDVEQSLIIEDILIGCTQAFLLCLDRPLRTAYVLGEIFDVSGDEGASILGISPAAFRKRLSRARTLIRNSLIKKCGLVNPATECRCDKQVSAAIGSKWLDPHNLLFANHPRQTRTGESARERLAGADDLMSVAAIFRSHPDYKAPDRFVRDLRELLDSGRFEYLGRTYQ